MVSTDDLKECGWNIDNDFFSSLSDYEKSFVSLEFTGKRNYNYYKERVDYLGLSGMDHVLDAGCGMGQWAVALADSNKHVSGIDLNASRIEVLKKLISSMGKNNISVTNGSIENLPYPENFFDAVFCYGVFMFTNMVETLSEFNRVLKPNGKLYVNANSYGWYIHLLRDVPWNRRPALEIIMNTLLQRQRAIIVGEDWFRTRLSEAGFNVRMIGSESDTTFRESVIGVPKPEAGYQRTYWGLRAVIEAVAVKV